MRNASVATLTLVCAALGLHVTAQAQQNRQNLSPEERARQQAEAERRLQEELRAPRAIEALNSIWIEELTWMEVRDAIAAGKTIAIVPTGGVEQNGPYVALGKHNYVLQGACEALARRLGNALCAPIVKFVPEGNYDPPTGHMRYPGTISVRGETFEALLDDIGTSLKVHGFEHIIYIGDSGGNQTGMANVAKRQNERWGRPIAHHIPQFYNYPDVEHYMETALGVKETSDDGFHDDYYITALMMTVDPTVVRYDQRVQAGKATINGLSIAPKERTIEIGKKLMDFRVDVTVKAIQAALAGAASSRP
ncbi:MAG TPA: creatininase family protein [Gemmatimonadales bacterium]|nr:creatininase family protein [Gemmatimonadales bacterium]